MSNLKPYPEYTETGEAWLGAVPRHWAVEQNRAFFEEKTQKNQPDMRMLSVTIHRGVLLQSKLLAGSSKKDSSNSDRSSYKVVERGNLVYNKMRAWQGAIGVSDYEGIVSPAYVVQRPRISESAGYFHWLYRTPAFAKEAERWSYGIASDMWSLRPEHFKVIRSCFPPLSEQRAIVRFLEFVDRRVQQYIDAKQRLIGLLEEQKQAIIHQAVTRGLDPDVPLKPSGVEWLGDIPQHWDLRRLRVLSTIKTGGRDTVDRVDGGKYPFYVRSQSVERINTWSYDGEAVLTAGDGAGVAKVFHIANGRFDYHQRVYKFSDFRGVSASFFFVYFSAMLRFEALAGNAKSTVDSLRLPMLQNFPVVVPPAQEQDRIAVYVQNQTSEIQTVVDQSERVISLLGEHQMRLTADVVTGRLDVREAAAALPDGADDAGSLSELADVADADDLLERLVESGTGGSL